MGKLFNEALNFHNNWNKPEVKEFKNKKLSIIIPVYRPKYLYEVLSHISLLSIADEVVVVFDGPDDSPEKIIKNYNFNLIVIKHNENYNAPAANNTGAAYASGDILLFLDQDMFLSPNFIPEMRLFFQNESNHGVVVGFRDTVTLEEVPDLNNWKDANYLNDWRIKTSCNSEFLDLTLSNCGSIKNNCKDNNNLEIYKESNGFRELGVASEKTIAFWDLPCMVISHTLAISKKDFFNIGGFPEWIKGWGGEDIALGFLATAAHIPIIPVKVGSYHIKHEPLSGSEEKKWQEMKENLKNYKSWATSIDSFPIFNKDICFSRSKIIYKSEK